MVVYTQTINGQTNHTIETTLDGGTQYYWRVTPQNSCGIGPTSAFYSFTTELSNPGVFLPVVLKQ
jgi:hypothetical protein